MKLPTYALWIGLGAIATATLWVGPTRAEVIFEDNFQTDTNLEEMALQEGDIGKRWTVFKNSQHYARVLRSNASFLATARLYGAALGEISDAAATKQSAKVVVSMNVGVSVSAKDNEGSGYGEIAGATGTAVDSRGQLTDDISFHLQIDSDSGVISYVNAHGDVIATQLTATVSGNQYLNKLVIAADYEGQTYTVALTTDGQTTTSDPIDFRHEVDALTGVYIGARKKVTTSDTGKRIVANFDNVRVEVVTGPGRDPTVPDVDGDADADAPQREHN